MDFEIFGFIVSGMLLLFLGAEALVRSSSSLGLKMGITPLIVGITIVGFGTSAPELVVSLEAAINGEGDVALGNIIGSNIANIGLVLGGAAIIRPIRIQSNLISIDIMMMILAAAILYLSSFLGVLTWWTGLIFTIGGIAYTLVTVSFAKKEVKYQKELEAVIELRELTSSKSLDFTIAIVSIATIFFGADLFLKGSISLAKLFGIQEAIIALTLVAIGTSLPEIATSFVAAYRGHSEISVGNVIGSNIYNILWVLGISSIITPIVMTGISQRDYLFMISLSLYLAYLTCIKKGISRFHGILMMTFYFIYIWSLFSN